MNVVLLGHGRLGSAITQGWRLTGAAVEPTVLTREKPVCPRDAQALILAVKPAVWREAAAPLADTLPSTAIVISVMAGVRAADIASVFPGRAVARVMPTTAVAQATGVAAIWSLEGEARAAAHQLFDPVADTVDLDDEAMIDVATAVAGSAPAFFYALAQTLADAGVDLGLSSEAAVRLARGALRSAGAGVSTSNPFDQLIARIASPGGTTQAGLKALQASGLDRVAFAAVYAAVDRARALARDQSA